MIPFRDHNPSNITPYVTIGIIAINVLVFVLELMLQASGQLDAFLTMWAVVPAELLRAPTAQELLTPFTAMFMHGGFAHIGGNMLYLWIFGDNVEARLGHVGYFVFYIVTGLAATFAQVFLGPNSTIPNLGASGAIAGVLGAYLVLYPRARVDTLVFRFVTAVPAIFVLGFWFILQLFYGVASIGQTSVGGGVAYAAHVGGFAAGAAIMIVVALIQGQELFADV